MNNIDPELLKRLDALAAKLGVTADHLWLILIKQAKVEIVSTLGFFAGSVIAMYYLIKYLRHIASKEDFDLEEAIMGHSFIRFFGVMIGAAVTIITFICATVALYEIPTLLFNPEYWALQEILRVVK